MHASSINTVENAWTMTHIFAIAAATSTKRAADSARSRKPPGLVGIGANGWNRDDAAFNEYFEPETDGVTNSKMVPSSSG
jgi:hypothetical protein